MGFFSWRTQDTDRSISNSFSVKETFTVYMVDNKGQVWVENNYEGYGSFGGKDYFELLIEMNGGTTFGSPNNGIGQKLVVVPFKDLTPRDQGINLAFGDSANQIIYPNLVENPEGWKYDPVGPVDCEFQGYFYDTEDIDDTEEEEEEEDLYSHLQDHNLIGGLTQPQSNSYWKSLPSVGQPKKEEGEGN